MKSPAKHMVVSNIISLLGYQDYRIIEIRACSRL